MKKTLCPSYILNGCRKLEPLFPVNKSAGKEIIIALILLSMILIKSNVFTQDCCIDISETEFYGMTIKGGENNTGTIYKTDGHGNNLATIYTFPPSNNEEIHSAGNLCPAPNGCENGRFPNEALIQVGDKLYGTTRFGGKYDLGILFEWDIATNTFTKKADFNPEVGYARGTLAMGGNGKLYGINLFNKPDNDPSGYNPVIFEWDPETNVISKKFEFRPDETGMQPHASSLVKADNGKLYGVTVTGGKNDLGVLYEWDPFTDTFSKKVDFGGELGGYPPFSLFRADNGRLYGYTNGRIFEWDPITNICRIRADLPNDIHIAGHFRSPLIQGLNGKFYLRAGLNLDAQGYIYVWDTITNEFSVKFSMDVYCNDGFESPLLQANDGKIYGTSVSYSGEPEAGVLFEFDPDKNDVKVKHTFKGPASGGLIEVNNYNNENNISISTLDILAHKNSTFEIPVYAKNINTSFNAVAYQFGFSFDPQKLQYMNYCTSGTLSENGILEVNQADGKLMVAWAGQDPITESGTLLKLYFKALTPGITMPVIPDFLLNTDTVTDIINGMINISAAYGDVDNNNHIQAYDAALTYLYSTGWNTFEIYYIPWEAWRIAVANVDGMDSITAYDASLILRRTVGLIDKFPVELPEMISPADKADMIVSSYNNEKAFDPLENLVACENILDEKVNTPEISVQRNRVFEIPVYVKNIESYIEGIAYQFDFSFDQQKMQYMSYSLDSTLSWTGILEINEVNGKLKIAWFGRIRTEPIRGSGKILSLYFKALESGVTTPVISDFLLNTDTITDIINGIITISTTYGDVDNNSYVQAYDAAITLQYSAGLDPLPSVDPLPWEEWRIETANVDGTDDITAYDASLILQKTVGLIDEFPVEQPELITLADEADVIVRLENNQIAFYPAGNLFGLNVSCEKTGNTLGEPDIPSNLMKVFNNAEESYRIAVASANPADENTAILKIPYTQKSDVTFDLTINNVKKSVTISHVTGAVEYSSSKIEVYPNPVKDEIIISGIKNPTTAMIYDLNGKLILSYEIKEPVNRIPLNNIPNGVYIIKLKNNTDVFVKRFVKE